MDFTKVSLMLVATALAGVASAQEPAVADPAGSAQGMGGAAEEPRERTGRSFAAVVRDWPDASRSAAIEMRDRYGEPDVIDDTMLVWHDNGPWKRTTVHRDAVEHRFPTPHQDVLEQVVQYDVPIELIDDLALFDGSLSVNRTRGEVTVWSDREGANFLALNLANEVARGALGIREARVAYGDILLDSMEGQEPRYMRGLQFEIAGQTGDPGVAIIVDGRVEGPGLRELNVGGQPRPGLRRAGQEQPRVETERGLEGGRALEGRRLETPRRLGTDPQLDTAPGPEVAPEEIDVDPRAEPAPEQDHNRIDSPEVGADRIEGVRVGDDDGIEPDPEE